MTGSLQNGRTSRKMLSFTLNVVSLQENACKIVRPFKPEFREGWQLLELELELKLFLSQKPRSDQWNSRSRLEA